MLLRTATTSAVLGLGLLLAPSAASAQTTPPPISLEAADPCDDPGLRCPDLVMREPYALSQRRGPTGRLLLASTNAIVNVGDGPAEVRARRVGARSMSGRQVIRGRTPAQTVLRPASARIDFFDTGTRGVYWKWRNALRLQLRRIDADGSLGAVASRSPKIYSCLRDLRRVSPLTGDRASYPGSPTGEQFGACSQDAGARGVTLGTSVGWADIYPFSYPQNSVPVGSLRGCFRYEHVVDPLDQLQEADEENNTAGVTVRLPWRGAGRRGCPVVDAG